MGGFKLGRILGFEITIDWSWLFIFFLVVYTLARGFFPMYYRFPMQTYWIISVVAAIALFASVLIHEICHSLVARRYGIEVKGITLFLFGGVSQTTDEPKSPKEEFWMSIVGPISSLVLAAIFDAFFGAGTAAGWYRPAVAVLGYVAFINFLLGLFNLIPGFPLDGGRVLRSILWGLTRDLVKSTRYASYVGQAFGFIMIAGGAYYTFSYGVFGGIWLIFIGWFLAGAARSSYQQVLMKQALSGVKIEQVMTTDVPVVSADMTLREFVDNCLMRYDYSCYPVTRDGDPIGVIGIEEVRPIPAREWDRMTTGEVAHLIDSAYKVNINDDAWEAVTKLTSQDVCRLVVMDDHSLIGTVGRDSVFRLVRSKMQMGM